MWCYISCKAAGQIWNWSLGSERVLPPACTYYSHPHAVWYPYTLPKLTPPSLRLIHIKRPPRLANVARPYPEGDRTRPPWAGYITRAISGVFILLLLFLGVINNCLEGPEVFFFAIGPAIRSSDTKVECYTSTDPAGYCTSVPGSEIATRRWPMQVLTFSKSMAAWYSHCCFNPFIPKIKTLHSPNLLKRNV